MEKIARHMKRMFLLHVKHNYLFMSYQSCKKKKKILLKLYLNTDTKQLIAKVFKVHFKYFFREEYI